MADEEAEVTPEVVPETPPEVPKRRRRKWPWIVGGTVLLGPVIVFAIWSWIALSYSYSEGERAGYVQKFSKKGWICKTWEGELSMVNIPGAAQERWLFSVRDDSVARQILNAMGTKVALRYDERRGIPTTCFGETNYFVDGVRTVPGP